MPQPTDIANVCCVAIELSMGYRVLTASGCRQEQSSSGRNQYQSAFEFSLKVRDQRPNARRRVRCRSSYVMKLVTTVFGLRDC